MSWLADTPEAALVGIGILIAEIVADMAAAGEAPPTALAEREYSGEFRVRIRPELHRKLVVQAAEQNTGRNRLASAKLAG